MDISNAINKVLNEYQEASLQPFANHPLANFIRRDFKDILQTKIIQEDQYLCKGSAGQGVWAQIPWVCIFDRLITTSAQSGYFPVFLFCSDMSGFYLSLNQGVTEILTRYKVEAKEALIARSEDFRKRIGDIPRSFPHKKIDLVLKMGDNLGRLYEAGNIIASFYPRGETPSNEELIGDILHMLGLYRDLSYNESVPIGMEGLETDEDGSQIENLKKFRQHKRIERNQKLSKDAKKALGTKCQACGFSFNEGYGELGNDYIEAHHLVPLSSLKGDSVRLNPSKDFAVLCSNCHAMIHRSEFVSDVAGFSKKYLQAL
jgi:5-methylcytosine-specific restriction protein A